MITAAGWLGMFIAVANTGHLFSPLLVLGIHDGLRAQVIQGWRRHVATASLVFLLTFMLPLRLVLGVYAGWNLYHYAMQHHGFWALTRWRARTRDQRLTMRTVWLAVTAVAMLKMPLLQWPMSLFHWFGDMGLSAWSMQRRMLFLALLVLLAMTGLVLMNHQLRQAFPSLVRFRLFLGIVHFVYSGLVWPAALPRKGLVHELGRR